jgi:alkyl hydroperoxide reductase subunit D
MNLTQLLDTVPAYAKDLKLNLSNLLQQPELSKQQIWGTAVTSAITSRNARLLAAINEAAAEHLKPEAMEAARAAAAIMGMNNIYYRFQHLAENKKYATIPARLRMNVIRTHGIEAVDFELFCIAASAINGCGVCIDSHEKVVREKGTGEEVILGCVRIASVIHALATVFDAEVSA